MVGDYASDDPNSRDTQYHGLNHTENGRDKVLQRLLSRNVKDATAGDPARGDLIVAQGAIPTLWKKKAKGASGTFLKAGATDVDYANIVSADVTDFVEAAQDAVGLMVANSPRITLVYADGTPALTADLVVESITPAYIANRIRRIPLVLFDQAGGVPVTDAHAALGALPHWHLANAVTTSLFGTPMTIMPTDYPAVTAPSLRIAWSTSVGGGNVTFLTGVFDYIDANPNANTNLFLTAAYAAPAAADTIKYTTIAFNANTPPVDSIVGLILQRIGADATDTNTGQVNIFAAWLEYNADS